MAVLSMAMSARFRSLVATVAASGSMFSPVMFLSGGDVLVDLLYFFYRSTVCNGGGTGDIRNPGSDETSYPNVGSVKCYAN